MRNHFIGMFTEIGKTCFSQTVTLSTLIFCRHGGGGRVERGMPMYLQVDNQGSMADVLPSSEKYCRLCTCGVALCLRSDGIDGCNLLSQVSFESKLHIKLMRLDAKLCFI